MRRDEWSDEAVWFCIEDDCEAGGTGKLADVDKAADRHTMKDPKHCTVTTLISGIDELVTTLTGRTARD